MVLGQKWWALAVCLVQAAGHRPCSAPLSSMPLGIIIVVVAHRHHHHCRTMHCHYRTTPAVIIALCPLAVPLAIVACHHHHCHASSLLLHPAPLPSSSCAVVVAVPSCCCCCCAVVLLHRCHVLLGIVVPRTHCCAPLPPHCTLSSSSLHLLPSSHHCALCPSMSLCHRTVACLHHPTTPLGVARHCSLFAMVGGSRPS